MRIATVLLGGLLAFAAPSLAHADTFTYNLNSYGGSDSFTASAPELVTTDLLVNTSTCEAAYLSCSAVDIDATDSLVRFYIGGRVALTENLPADFFLLGIHSFQFGTMTITDVPSLSPTPEPSGLILLGTGALGLLGAARRRLRRT